MGTDDEIYELSEEALTGLHIGRLGAIVDRLIFTPGHRLTDTVMMSAFAPNHLLDSLPQSPPPTRLELYRRKVKGWWLWIKYLPLNVIRKAYGVSDDEWE